MVQAASGTQKKNKQTINSLEKDFVVSLLHNWKLYNFQCKMVVFISCMLAAKTAIKILIQQLLFIVLTVNNVKKSTQNTPPQK